jgi:type I restriction enzyme S subunit
MWPAGTLCITIAANIADTAILGFDACFPDSVIGFIPDDKKADTRFIKYLFDALLQRKYKQFTQGAAQDNLSQAKLLSLKFPIPGITEQKQIADVLSAYDDRIENKRRRIQLLEQAARLLYKEWFVHLRFPGHEHTKIVDGVSEGWEKKLLGELLTLQRGFDLPVSKRKEGLFPIYASTGINGYHAEAKVKGPCVVTGRSGSLGTVMFVSSDFWPLNTTLWVKEFKLVGPHYANHLLANMQLEQYNGGAAVPTLNRNDVHRVKVLSPPSMLLRMFEDQSHDIVKLIEALTSMNLKLAKARDLLLPKLMNGEVAV